MMGLDQEEFLRQTFLLDDDSRYHYAQVCQPIFWPQADSGGLSNEQNHLRIKPGPKGIPSLEP